VTLWALLPEPTVCAANVKEVEERLAAGVLTVPVRLTVWVEGLALSVMVSKPVVVPVLVGLKVTLTEQEAFEARLGPQELAREKLPLIATLITLRGTVPVFSRVTLCGLALELRLGNENDSEVAERLATGRAPVPERLTVWVEGLAVSVTVSKPLRAPVVVGVKIRLNEHEALAASWEVQLLVWEKSPLTPMLEMVRGTLAVF
jgi:hypothetical protein